MSEVRTRLAVALVLMGVTFGVGSAGAFSHASSAGASASAFGIKVLVPGAAGASRAEVTAPPDTVGFASGFAYPADGSVVTTGSIATSASSDVGVSVRANASAEISSVSLFRGEVTASSVVGKAEGSTSGQTATGDLSGSGVSGLTVNGAAASGGRVALGDWGYAIALEQASVK